MSWQNVLFITVGSLFVLSGITKIGFNRRRAQRLVQAMGEMPARITYIVLGAILIIVSLFVELGS